jgi:type II secretory pathway pseudopilin PulG
MRNNTKITHDGFVHLIVVIVVGLVVAAALLAIISIKDSQDKTSSSSKQQEVAQGVDTLQKTTVAKSEEVPVASTESSTSPEQTKDVAPTEEPVAPVTQPQPSAATAFTIENCTGNTTAYASNPNGSPALSPYPGQAETSVSKNYSFGQSLTVYCMKNSGSNYPDYATIDGSYIKFSDLSPTKP